MQISPSIIEDVLNQANIVDIVSDYIELEKKGRNYVGLCPFHGDSNPSMSVSDEKKIYKCFSCGAGGNVIKFVQDYEKIPFLQALKKVADKTGINIDIKVNNTSDKYKKYYKINEQATELYELYLLNTKQGKSALQYLYDRGLTVDTIKQFRIGLASTDNNLLYRTLKEKNVENLDLINLGLVKSSENGFYDLFRNRIIFPIWDKYGNVGGFSGRTFNNQDKSKKEPKYVNSIETPIFKKSELLYNYHNALIEIRKTNRVVLFEGFMDVIAAYNVGIKEGVATMGTALTPNHVSLLKQVTKNVTICFDGDNAGLEATFRAIKLLKEFNLKIAILPDGLDPDDFIKKHSKEKFVDYINNKTVSVVEFIFKYQISKINKNNLNDIEEFKKRIFSFIKNSSNTQIEFYLKKIANEFDVSYESVSRDFLSVTNKKVIPIQKVRKNYHKKFELAEKVLLAYMLTDKNIALKINNQIGENYVKKEHEIIRYYLMQYYKENIEYEMDSFINLLPIDLKVYFIKKFSISRYFTEKEINDCLKTLNNYKYQQKLELLQQEFKKNLSEEKKIKIAGEINNIHKYLKWGGSNE